MTLSFAFLTGCSVFNTGFDVQSSFGVGCDSELKTVFVQSYQPLLVENCASCHAVGGIGKGVFADEDLDIAFEDFKLRGYQLVSDRAVDPNHRPPSSGPHLQPEVTVASDNWIVALEDANSCTSNSSVPLPDDEPAPESATYLTMDKVIAMGDNANTMSWDLTNDIVTPAGTSYTGAQFEISVEVDTSATGVTSYLLSNPTLSAGDSPLRVTFVEVYINGNFISSASTFRGINRYVPQNETRELSETTMVVPFEVADGDTLSMAFGILDPVDFNPSTFTQLTNSVFAQNCNSCHSGGNPAAGLDMTNYDEMLNQFIVIPFSTNGSEVYKRMTDANNPMPPSGLLPEAAQNNVRDWVRDGAPN